MCFHRVRCSDASGDRFPRSAAPCSSARTRSAAATPPAGSVFDRHAHDGDRVNRAIEPRPRMERNTRHNRKTAAAPPPATPCTLAHRHTGAPTRNLHHSRKPANTDQQPPNGPHGHATGIRAKQEQRANRAGSARRGGFWMDAPRLFLKSSVPPIPEAAGARPPQRPAATIWSDPTSAARPVPRSQFNEHTTAGRTKRIPTRLRRKARSRSREMPEIRQAQVGSARKISRSQTERVPDGVRQSRSRC